jgi:excinuclease ABC subunit C
MEQVTEGLRNKIKSLPDKPGVYKYLDEHNTIIYVGKAKNIRKRVISYFQKEPEHAKTRLLVRKIRDISYVVVNTEQDALLLENNLIKEHQPKYNIQLKDDKTYPWICIKKEPFPRVFTTRRVVRDGSLYFGPYPNGKLMHTILRLIRELFPLRTCIFDLSKKHISSGKYKVCLEYHIGNCLGPCVGKQSEEAYNDSIQKIIQILKGNSKELLHVLNKQMLDFSSQLAFEEAEKDHVT